MLDDSQDLADLGAWSLWNIPEIWNTLKRRQRRQLRSAIRNKDIAQVKLLLNKGVSPNITVSETFRDTPLTYAVKDGWLDLVECLLGTMRYGVDKLDETNPSALDLAINSWIVGALNQSESKQKARARCRILKCLLVAGAETLNSHCLLRIVSAAVASTFYGHNLINTLVRVVCQHGSQKVKDVLMSVLVGFKHMRSNLMLLLGSGGNPRAYLSIIRTPTSLPISNALTLIQATNDSQMLHRLHVATTSPLKDMELNWLKHKQVLHLLAVCGVKLHLNVVNYLYNNHTGFFRWYYRYRTSPRPLSHLCRICVRKNLQPNVIMGLKRLKKAGLPERFTQYLLLSVY